MRPFPPCRKAIRENRETSTPPGLILPGGKCLSWIHSACAEARRSGAPSPVAARNSCGTLPGDAWHRCVVICEDTNVSPFVVEFLQQEGCSEEDVLQIDSDKKGEVGDKKFKEWRAQNASIKDMMEWSELTSQSVDNLLL